MNQKNFLHLPPETGNEKGNSENHLQMDRKLSIQNNRQWGHLLNSICNHPVVIILVVLVISIIRQ